MAAAAALDIDHLRTWIGRQETAADTVSPVPVQALAATLDSDGAGTAQGDRLPPLWHWLFFLPLHRQSELGLDGHPRRGGFLPPVPLPRRMWAGGRLRFLRPLRVGDRITRTSTVADVSLKQGRQGSLVFVLVRHVISGPGGEAAIEEEHDIVYRDMPGGDMPGRGKSAPSPGPAASAAGPAAPDGATWSREIRPDPVLLFRYSALTFNGHRIHYDRSYVTGEESYPGLVVHGPLIATLLAGLAGSARPDRTMTGFTFRALSPLFDTAPFQVCGAPSGESGAVDLWAQAADGRLAMRASATFEPQPA